MKPRLRRAFVLLDAVLGLMLLVGLAGILTSMASDYARTGGRLGERAEALHQAEAVLQQLHCGKRPALPSGVTVSRLEADDVPAGYSWIEVRAATSRAPICLTGLVPAGALEGATR